MIKQALLATALLGLAGPVHAVQTLEIGRTDSRVRTVADSRDQVFHLEGTVGIASQVEFGAGETIKAVSVGRQAAWVSQPVGRFFFFRPKISGVGAQSNAVIVTTLADGSERTYAFELAARAEDALHGSPALFILRFRYPEDERKAAAERARAARAASLAQREAARVSERLATAGFEAPRNWRYLARGDVGIAPREVSDDGNSTSFRWPGNLRTPVIYAVDAKGEESIVPYTVQADVLVVPRVAPLWRLRLNREVLDVMNVGYDPVGRNPGTGTTVPDVVRQVREAAR